MPGTSQGNGLEILVSLALYLVIGLLFGIITRNMAEKTKRNPIGLFFLGFFLGPLGYLAAREICGLNKHQSFRMSSTSKKQTGRDLY
jgi:hypothetical protein